MKSWGLTFALLVMSAVSACTPPQPAKVAATSCGLPKSELGTYVTIPASTFVAGARPQLPEEGPPTRVQVAAFQIQRHEVTNDQFAAFVSATGYVTDAEKSAQSGRADGGSGIFTRPKAGGVTGAWSLVKGATWRAPKGPGSNIETQSAWPVVHVSYRDALAYADWAKARLPTEIEWEYAASMGLPDISDSRSGAFDAKGKPTANTWQGLFPLADDGSDGFLGVAPVGCFAPDAQSLSDMIGNVWEWTALPEPSATQSIIKGGSHLCTDSFCGRFRPEARQLQEVDFSTNHIGFRVVKDAQTQ
jgi:formylglycine-generating enzyme